MTTQSNPRHPSSTTGPRSFAGREQRVNLGARSIITLSLALVVAACGGGTSNPGGSSGGDASSSQAAAGQPAASTPAGEPSGEPQGDSQGAGGLCDYLSREAAATALGEAVDEGVASSSSIAGSDMCRYTATASDHTILIEHSAGNTRAAWDVSMTKTGMIEEQPLADLGEAAYRSTDAVFGPGTRLAAFDHGTAIWVVILTDADPATVYAAAEAVAHDLLAAVTG